MRRLVGFACRLQRLGLARVPVGFHGLPDGALVQQEGEAEQGNAGDRQLDPAGQADEPGQHRGEERDHQRFSFTVVSGWRSA
jgi:hypothetical protein